MLYINIPNDGVRPLLERDDHLHWSFILWDLVDLKVADEANLSPESSGTVRAGQRSRGLCWRVDATAVQAACLVLAVSMRCCSYAAAPLWIALRHADRSCASVSHELWSTPKSFMEALSTCPWSISSGLHDRTLLALQPAVLCREGAWVVVHQTSWWHVQPSGVVTCGAWWRHWTFLSARESLCWALCPATSLSAVCEGSWGGNDWVSLCASGRQSRSRWHTVEWWGWWHSRHSAPVTCYVTVIPYCQPAVSLANVHTSYQTHASFRCQPCFVLHTNKVNCGFDSIYWRGGSVHTSNQRLWSSTILDWQVSNNFVQGNTMAATSRAPKQWSLKTRETLNSFENWKHDLIYTLSLDPNFAPFLVEGVKWEKKTKANPVRGFGNDGEPIPEAQRLTAQQKVSYLELLLGQIANFCPIISRNTIVKNSTSLESIWQSIRLHFGFQTTGAHFIDFDNIHLEPDERPEDLFQRLMAFVEDSLLKPNVLTHHGEAVLEDEELSPSLENFVVLTWLRLIDPELPKLIKQRYGTELRTRTLASLKPEISQALDSLLDELKCAPLHPPLPSRPAGFRTRPLPRPPWDKGHVTSHVHFVSKPVVQVPVTSSANANFCPLKTVASC